MSNRLNSWCSFSYSQSWFRSVHFKHLELGWCRQSSPGPSAFPSSSALWLNHQRVCGREREREEQILSQHTLSLPLAEPAEECECVSMDKCVCVCAGAEKRARHRWCALTVRISLQASGCWFRLSTCFFELTERTSSALQIDSALWQVETL